MYQKGNHPFAGCDLPCITQGKYMFPGPHPEVIEFPKYVEAVRAGFSGIRVSILGVVMTIANTAYDAFFVVLWCNAITRCLLFVSCTTEELGGMSYSAVVDIYKLALTSCPRKIAVITLTLSYAATAITVSRRYSVKSSIPRLPKLGKSMRVCNLRHLWRL
ncbi:hypothetical protein ARMGADRAFT_759229 [Armillaria gallica]|uniref:Uncharacterized protein n=1 Tax=Armillaria gallica TaxID=47427 RepID=A0A2H3DPY1_ARMGA|nr:hypothetical protein ARMGADRAFT_759229 [Armillaria gallica]